MLGWNTVVALLSLITMTLAENERLQEAMRKRLFLLPKTVFGREERRADDTMLDTDLPAAPSLPTQRFKPRSVPLFQRGESTPNAAWRAPANSKSQRSRQCYFTPVQCVLYVPSNQYEQLVKAVPFNDNAETNPTPEVSEESRKKPTTRDMLQKWRRTEVTPLLRGYWRRSAV
ncbi:unnamed protein product [Bursaphelenchus okinawaensis]|uniref:Uncharacterized protein n=1 Tax=Bursaphelenchus okinawaensis TaxID=465554 RepID=A0A811KZH7_9BILA|nr:unnamed protein product [Bursaphelenchus okinawaensis]CAG9114208.1 unnamed protein product [Bursaphelenchus okinawaensis]